jgi:hypothetical protein
MTAPDQPGVRVDRATIEHAISALERRLHVVATYGAGGCPTCHDAELRGAIVLLRELLSPAARSAAGSPAAVAVRRRR